MHITMAATFVGLTFASGCSAQKPPVTAERNGTAKPFSLDTPVSVIAADEGGKAVLKHDVPGLMASSSYILLEGMSLSQIAPLSGGRLTKAKLAEVQADLAKLATRDNGAY
jgi:hypothetical protein